MKENSAASQVLKVLQKNKQMPVYELTAALSHLPKKSVTSALTTYTAEDEFQLWHIAGYTVHPTAQKMCRVFAIGKGRNAEKHEIIETKYHRELKPVVIPKPCSTLFQLLKVMNEAHQNQQQCSA